MRILDRIGIIRALFPVKAAAADVAARWARAAREEPELMADVLRLGGVLALQPDIYEQGVPIGAPIDPIRHAQDKGRRDFAVQLCALMGLTVTELNSLMEDDYDVS